jgi:hypothetical protein
MQTTSDVKSTPLQKYTTKAANRVAGHSDGHDACHRDPPTSTMEERMNGGQGLVVTGVLYHDPLDPARAFAAEMQASAWPDGMKIESLWLALDCVKLRHAPEQGELTPHVASLAVRPGRLAATDQIHPGPPRSPREE